MFERRTDDDNSRNNIRSNDDNNNNRNNNPHSPYLTSAHNTLWRLHSDNSNSSNNNSNSNVPSTPSTSTSSVDSLRTASIPQNNSMNHGGAVQPQPTSVINLSNSSDIVIGPMTQYQGPVTIYQYMDATVEAHALQQARSDGSNPNRNAHRAGTSNKRTKTSKLLLFFIALILLTVGVIVYVELNRDKKVQEDDEIYFSNNYDHSIFPNLGNGHLVIDRKNWGASEFARPLRIVLYHPIPYVLITHIGVQSSHCDNIYKCSIKMRTIQDAAISEKNLTDIGSNFYVGGDGYIYVGRGWDRVNTYANNTLAVTFMGDYGRYTPSARQLEATQYLLAYAIANQKVSLDYKLVAQNQTKQSKSPGVNVYREIRNWPHFYPCGMDDNPKCGAELGMPAVWDGNM